MTAIYSIIWGIIFAFLGEYLTGFDNLFFNFVGYACWIMCILSLVTLGKYIGFFK